MHQQMEGVTQYRGTLGAVPPIPVSDLEMRKDIPDGNGATKCAELLFRDRSIEKFVTPEKEEPVAKQEKPAEASAPAEEPQPKKRRWFGRKSDDKS
jgi:hypothetical protein